MKALPKVTLARLAAAAVCGFLFQQAQAAGPIVGSIDFNGVVTYDTTSLATATKVNLWNSSFVTKDTGSFTSVAPGTNASMANNWMFNSNTPALPMPGPATPSLWQVGAFTFNLSSSTVVAQSSTFLNVTGVGTATGTGFDPTPGTWSFTSSRANGQDSQTFGFQSSTAVPESGTLVLLAIGALFLCGMHLLRKKRQILLAAKWAPF